MNQWASEARAKQDEARRLCKINECDHGHGGVAQQTHKPGSGNGGRGMGYFESNPKALYGLGGNGWKKKNEPKVKPEPLSIKPRAPRGR